jgi:hypothetical protein
MDAASGLHGPAVHGEFTVFAFQPSAQLREVVLGHGVGVATMLVEENLAVRFGLAGVCRGIEVDEPLQLLPTVLVHVLGLQRLAHIREALVADGGFAMTTLVEDAATDCFSLRKADGGVETAEPDQLLLISGTSGDGVIVFTRTVSFITVGRVDGSIELSRLEIAELEFAVHGSGTLLRG